MKFIERKGNITVKFRNAILKVVRFPLSNIAANHRSFVVLLSDTGDNYELYVLSQYIVGFHPIR